MDSDYHKHQQKWHKTHLDDRLIGHQISFCTHSPEKDLGVSKYINEHGSWEPFESEIFLKILADKSCFLDIGANIGYYTVLAATEKPRNLSCIALEPDTENFELLRHNVEQNNLSDVVVLHAGCGEVVGQGLVIQSEKNLGDHHLFVPDVASGNQSENAVDILTVDTLVNSYDIRPDIIKIDTQGCEFSILRGMEGLLNEHSQNFVLIMEYWPYGLKKHGERLSACLNELEKLRGFSMYCLYEEQRKIRKCSPSEVAKWTDTTLEPNSEEYINLIFTEPTNETLEDLLVPYYPKALKYDELYPAVSENRLNSHFIWSGWSYPEAKGVWSQRSYSEIFFSVDVSSIPLEEPIICLSIVCQPFVTSEDDPVSFWISVGENLNQEVVLNNASRVRINIPLTSESLSMPLSLLFSFKDPISPCEKGLSEDQRKLSLFVFSIELKKSEYSDLSKIFVSEDDTKIPELELE